jgi:GGDEF domain-containing protein
LSQKWFAFLLRWALRHAARQPHYLALVTIRARREYVGSTIDIGSHALVEVADAIDPMIRATDLTGELEDGRLGLLLSEADHDVAFCVIQRFAEALGQVRFSVAMAFAIGFACCPRDGVEIDGVVAHAMMHPVLDVRAEPASLAAACLAC